MADLDKWSVNSGEPGNSRSRNHCRGKEKPGPSNQALGNFDVPNHQIRSRMVKNTPKHSRNEGTEELRACALDGIRLIWDRGHNPDARTDTAGGSTSD